MTGCGAGSMAVAMVCEADVNAVLGAGKRLSCGKFAAETTVTGTISGADVSESAEWRNEANNRLSSAACNSNERAGA